MKLHFDRSWVDFDAKKGSAWVENRIQNGSKTIPKIDQTHDLSFDRFLELPGGLIIIDGAARGANPGGPPPKLIAKAISDIYNDKYSGICNISYKLICYKDKLLGV